MYMTVRMWVKWTKIQFLVTNTDYYIKFPQQFRFKECDPKVDIITINKTIKYLTLIFTPRSPCRINKYMLC